jgi:hypothetical protein
MGWTIESIAERNPHLSVEDVSERAKLTTAMLKRISEFRQDSGNALFFDASEMTDEEVALQFVAEDAARARNEIERANTDAEIAARNAANSPTHYSIEYVNEYGHYEIEMPNAELAAGMANRLLTDRAWGKVSSVTVTTQFDGRGE